MTPTLTLVRMTGSADRAALPLLVLGPSLGSSATTLWNACARAGLTEAFDVVGWDLPGHGHNHAVPEESVTVADLARGVLRVLDGVQEQRGDLRGPFYYAGDSVGGAVGLQLLLDAPARVISAAVICSGASIGSPEGWADRIGQVRASGTPGQVAGSTERWFGPGFLERSPEIGSALLQALTDVDDTGYVRVCEALADFDLCKRLGEIDAPVLAIAGDHDRAAPVEGMQLVADGVRQGRLVVLDDVAHLAPAEAPDEVARLLLEHFLGPFETGLDGPPQGPEHRVPEERGTSISKAPSSHDDGPSETGLDGPPQGPEHRVPEERGTSVSKGPSSHYDGPSETGLDGPPQGPEHRVPEERGTSISKAPSSHDDGPSETGLDGPPQGPEHRVPEERGTSVSKGPSSHYDAGMAVRRAVLGDAHVDRSIAATTDLTADFQELITEYAWGSIWTRPGLDRRSRSMITLTALIANGHDEELAMHLRAARTNGLTDDEIKEVILQSAIYCGVPAANTAFRIAQQELDS